MGIGVQIQRAMKARKRDGADIARFLGISQSAVSQWFSKDSGPKLERLKLLAAYFHTTVEWLLSDDPWPTAGFAEPSTPFAGEQIGLENEITEIIERLKKVRERLPRPERKRPRK